MSTPDELKLAPTSVGLMLSNPTQRPPWSVDPETYWSIVPPPPASSIRAAVVPKPEVPSSANRDLLRLYHRAWRAATFRHLGLPTPGPSGLSKRKNYAAMVQGARMLVEHAIAPEYWAAFGYHVWRDHMRKFSKVPIGWLFSPQFVGGHVSWGLDHAADHPLGGRVVFTPTLRKLVRTYASMTRMLHLRRPLTPDRIESIVDAHFPGRAYQTQAKDAAREADEARTELSRRIEAGEWVW